jgi:hypothetical protein
MEKQIIFEDEHIRVIWMPGNSEQLILSFGDLITRAKGNSINAEKSLAKYQFNVLGIMPKERSWFPAHSMHAMLHAIRPILAKFKQRVAYAGSMGGYAAIKYSKLLDCQRVVALVPQYSIDPQDVDDPRYNMFFHQENNRDMRVSKDDVSADCEYIIVYDPYCVEDRRHYEKLHAVLPNLHTLNLPFTGHDAIAVLASSELLNEFLTREFDAEFFYQKMRQVKKNSKFYYRKVIENLLPRHRFALGRILKNNHLALDQQFFDNKLKQSLVRELLSNKQVSQQDLEKLGIQFNLPQENQNHLLDSFEHALVFNIISQNIESYTFDAIDLNHKFLIPIYAQHNALVRILVNDEPYLITMNDRHIMKLCKVQDPLGVGMHPLILKKYSDYYVLSYKDLNLSSNAFGATEFSDSLNERSQFVTQID